MNKQTDPIQGAINKFENKKMCLKQEMERFAEVQKKVALLRKNAQHDPVAARKLQALDQDLKGELGEMLQKIRESGALLEAHCQNMQNSFNELRKVTFQEEQGGVQVAISKPKQHRTMRSMV